MIGIPGLLEHTTVVAESLFFQNYFAKNYLGCAWSSNLKLCFTNGGNFHGFSERFLAEGILSILRILWLQNHFSYNDDDKSSSLPVARD